MVIGVSGMCVNLEEDKRQARTLILRIDIINCNTSITVRSKVT